MFNLRSRMFFPENTFGSAGPGNNIDTEGNLRLSILFVDKGTGRYEVQDQKSSHKRSI